jgi:hypothetical protein
MEALQKITDITAMQSLMLQALAQLSKDNLSESGNAPKRDWFL